MADDILGTLGSIVGIGVGSIDLQLIKTSFTAGETVHGRVQLALTRPTEAKRLMVAVRGTRERVTIVRDARGHKSERRETELVYELEHQLDGKRTYQTDAYDLHLPIPPDAVAARLQPPDGKLGDVLRIVSAFVDVGPRPVVWHVLAWLDIPWKANIKKQLQISVQAPR